MKLLPELGKPRKLEPLLAVLLLGAGIVLRLLFLTADPPRDITISGGIIGDPGQYQYGARNQVLFGQPVLDRFAPHLFSPLIHGLNILVYSAFGVNLTTHRLIPLAFSILILLFFWIMTRRLLDPPTAMIATAFLAFSYPVLVYSHVAYREYPMTFFALLSFWAFAKGAESSGHKPFILSAIFFILSFLSKGSGIFLLAVFAGVGLVWLAEKRIRWRQLTVFVLTLAGGFTLWWLTLFRPNREILKTLLMDNSNVRKVESLSVLLHNLWNSPMMTVLRSDPVLFLAGAFSLFWIIRERFYRPRALPPILDMAFAWLLVGSLFHGIVSYRPTRFYLMLVPPLALITGAGLRALSTRKNTSRPGFFALLPSLLLLALTLLAIGFPAYFSTTSQWPPVKLALHLAVLTLLLLLSITGIRIRLRYGLIALLVGASMVCNLGSWRKWAAERQYEIPSIVEILTKAIPPGRIAGNWAAHLSIGTPHRTYYAWPGFFNWERNFLARNQVDTLLLARHRNFDEISYYRDFFQEEWSRSQGMAEFDLHNAKVQLIRILPKNDPALAVRSGSPRVLEMEWLPRSKGYVRFDASASQKMSLVVPDADRFEIHLPSPLPSPIEGIALRARGRFSLQIIRKENSLARVLVNAAEKELKEVHRLFPTPLDLSGENVTLRIEALDKGEIIVLDRISLFPHQKKGAAGSAAP